MYVIIYVLDNLVKNVDAFHDESEALDHAVTVCKKNGATESLDTIRTELQEDGQYVPISRFVIASSYQFNWSVAFIKL